MLSNNSIKLHHFFILIKYLLYRLIRTVIQFESDIFATLKCLIHQSPSSTTNSCEILNILYRKRFHVNDVARIADFITFHECMTTCEVLWEPKWMLYTIDEHYAYFVHMPQPSFSYSVLTTSYITICQFANAEFVARIPNDVFIAQSEMLQNIAGQIITVSTMAASGSTLFVRMLQACDATTCNLLVVSEPDAFSAIALHLANFSMPIQKARTLLLASLRFLCKDQLPQQTLIFKMRSNCTRLVPHLKAIAPHVRHMYIGRRSLEQAIVSQIILSEHDQDLFRMLLSLNKIHPVFCDWITTSISAEWSLMRMIQPCSIIEFFIAFIAQSSIDFLRYQECFITSPIYYEDLVHNTDDTLKGILEAFNIPQSRFSECLNSKLNHDQYAANDSAEDYELTESDRQLLMHICSLIDYPINEQ